MVGKSKENMADLTEGGITKKLVIFAVPVLLGNLLQELYMMVDTLIVGRTLGVDKLAAVGSCSPLIFIIIGFLLGMSGGCSVLTSNSYGAKDDKALKKSVAAHIIISFVATVILTSGATFFVEELLSLLKTTDRAFQHAAVYLTVMYAGIPAAILYNLCSASMRAVGDSRTPLLFLIFSSILNIVLDLVFILVCKWDVMGVALATVLSQLVSGILCFVFIKMKYPILIPDRESWKDLRSSLLFELKVGIPMGLQFSIVAAGFIVQQYVLNGFGADAVAAFTIGGRIQSLMLNPMSAAGVVIATFVGQNFGAKRYERIKAGVLRAMAFTIIVAAVGGTLIWLFDDRIILCFIQAHETHAIALARVFLAWSCPLAWMLTFVFVTRGALQGIGDGFTPMFGAVLELIMRSMIPLYCSVYFGFTAVCISGPAAWAACGLLTTSVYWYRISRLCRYGVTE